MSRGGRERSRRTIRQRGRFTVVERASHEARLCIFSGDEIHGNGIRFGTFQVPEKLSSIHDVVRCATWKASRIVEVDQSHEFFCPT